MIVRIGNRRRRQRGGAVIEFALAFVVLVPLFLGAFQFGYAFYVYNQIQTAVRAGARYASLATYDSASATPTANFSSAVQNTVVYGSPDGGTDPVVPGLTPSDVILTVQFLNDIPAYVTVGVATHRANAVVAIVQVKDKPFLTVPYTGRWDPM